MGDAERGRDAATCARRGGGGQPAQPARGEAQLRRLTLTLARTLALTLALTLTLSLTLSLTLTLPLPLTLTLTR